MPRLRKTSALFLLGIVSILTILLFAWIQVDGDKDGKAAASKADNRKLLIDSLSDSISSDIVNLAIGCVFPESESSAAKLLKKLRKAIESLIAHQTRDSVIHFHIITNKMSHPLMKEIPDFISRQDKSKNFVANKLSVHDITIVTRDFQPLLPVLRKNFGSLDAIYYMSIALHRHFTQIDKIILLDADVHLTTNILNLFSYFDSFDESHAIGMAHEQQPVYGNLFTEFRQSTNNKSFAGLPLPRGNPGVNSGVMLLNLEKLRKTSVLDEYLNGANITQLAEKYHFRGHLGDQDFYTLLTLEDRNLIKILPCTWNRQLCKWWKFHGRNLFPFEEYNECKGKVKLYHGNCNSAIPSNV